ncbi:MAG: hypothetical protein L6R28_21000 [Planctomycetes bacterium]|nr:hypothetical protein [Planctomycetota bacterium]
MRTTMPYRLTLAAVAVLGLGLGLARAEDTSAPLDEPFAELPTVHCLGVRWKVKGDANANAEIAVGYRKAGAPDWKAGYPLFRTHPNPNPENESPAHTVAGGWMFAGSVVGLEGDTEYEVKLNLKDPDGGEAEKILKMKTWKEPEAPKGLAEKHVAPGNGGGAGTKEDPFKGLDAAFAAAAPATLFLLHAGKYAKEGAGENTFELNATGEEGKPIIFRGAGDGEAILDGGGTLETDGRLVSLKDGIKHIWFEDLTFTGKSYAIVGHECSNLVLRRCKFRNVTKGLTAHNGDYNKSQHHWISDNDFVGPTTWPRTKGIESFTMVYMTGGGHVVAYNKMYNVGDGLHGCGHGSWSACDLYANDMNICTDDGLETDHSDFNIRVWGNRVRNTAHGITAQPSHGGPTYIWRNVIYSATHSPFKLHNHTTGVLLFHNTTFKQKSAMVIQPAHETVTNIVTRNNLFLTAGGSGLNVTTPNMRKCDFDSDGYGGFGTFATWNARKTYKTVEDAKAGGEIYCKIGAYVIDPKTCFLKGTLPPADENKEYSIEEMDWQLAEKSDAVDKGVVLPNFNDGFAGKAPDLGALEFGAPMPHFGLRERK